MEEAERAMQEDDEPNVFTKPDIQDAAIVVATPVPSNEIADNGKKRRALLKRSNVVFKNVQDDKPVDLLAIYDFIKEHFLSALTQQCEWVAVFCYFNNCKKLLAITEATKFAEQMMSPEWFGELKDNSRKTCSTNGMKPYSFIYFEKDPYTWDISKKPNSSHASANGLQLIRNRYTDMELEGKSLNFLVSDSEAKKR